MDSNYSKIFQFVYDEEIGSSKNGGYVFHPNDPGGETKYGLSDRGDGVLDGMWYGKPIKDLTKQDMYEALYTRYYVPSGADRLDFPLAACVFDTAVNMGVSKAKRFLKECEGRWGTYLELRSVNYLNIITHNPKLRVFQNGWMNRINRLKTFILVEQPSP